MTFFWIISALMILAGLLALAPALLRRTSSPLQSNREQNVAIAREHLKELEAQLTDASIDQQSFEQERDELEKGLLQDVDLDETTQASTTSNQGRYALVIAGIVVPVLPIALYLYLGSPQYMDIAGPGADVQSPHAGVADGKAPTAEELVSLLEERIKADPENPDNLFMMGRMYATTGRYDDAVKAYEKLVSVTHNHPSALVVLADALAMAQGGRISGRPMQIIEQALALEPDNATALWLAGRGSSETSAYAAALDYYSRAALQLADKPELLSELNEQMQEVRSAAQSAGIALPAADVPEAATALSLQVSVSLAPALQADLAATDTLFIFARAAEGPPMPIAAIKRQAGELPLQVVLDDSTMLRPGNTLSQYPQIKLAARISKSGQPVASSGDLQSALLTVRPGKDGSVILVIDQRVP